MAALWPDFKARLRRGRGRGPRGGDGETFSRAFPLHGFGPWLDTLAVSRAVLPDLPGHLSAKSRPRLGLWMKVRALCPALDWHDALFDAVACLVILRRIVGRCGLAAVTVGELLLPRCLGLPPPTGTTAHRRGRRAGAG